MPGNPHPNAHPGAGAYTNAGEIAGELIQVGIRAQAKSIALVKHHAMLTETRVKARASGRPGPRARTGAYRRSWTTSGPFLTGSTVRATVGTNAAQARRLEYGFVGADRLGRVFNQPPFPHFAPAIAETATALAADVSELVSWS